MVSSNYQRGLAYYNLKRYDEAIVALHKAHAENPNDPEIFVIAAWCYYKTKRASVGLKVAGHALSMNPNYVRALIVHSACSALSGKYELATQSILSALALAPEDAFAHYHYAYLLAMRRKYKESLTAIELSTNFDPSNALYQTYRSHLLSVLGKKSEAKRAALEALRLDPEDSPSHVQHGKVLRNEGSIRASMQSMAEALRNDPTNKVALKELLRTSRSRFLPYRWFLQLDQGLLRYSLLVRVTALLFPCTAVPIFVNYPDSKWALGFLFLSLVFLFGELGVKYLMPSILDGFLICDPKFRYILGGNSRLVALTSSVSLVLGVVSLVIWLATQIPFYALPTTAFLQLCFFASIIYRVMATDTID